jgi:hypothetical protein
MYPNVLYEFASVFWVPAFGSDPELRESVYLRVMISIRNLAYFFTFRENGRPFEQDVFAWQFFDGDAGNQFKGEANAVKIPKEDIDKISKQIAHISFGRCAFKGEAKRWKIELRDVLRGKVKAFIEALFEHHSTELQPEVCKGFQQLYRFLEYKKFVTRLRADHTSNTAFEVTVLNLDPMQLGTPSVIKILTGEGTSQG